MRALLTKNVLLLASVITVSAFAVPSMAAAASWGPVGAEGTLISPDFTVENPGALFLFLNTSCTETTFTGDVRSSAVLAITSATFRGCTSTGFPWGSCIATLTGTNFPWTVTGVTTANVQIHNINIVERYDALPGGTNGCLSVGTTTTLTGTLSGGQWTSSQHEVTYHSALGLAVHHWFGGTPRLSATLREPSQSLTLT
jgi:hypothetical protein